MSDPPLSSQNMPEAAFTQTTALGGQVMLRQSLKGYRFGMDGAILAAFCAAQIGQGARGLELGCGVGGVMVSLKKRRPDLKILGLERDAHAVNLARQNIDLNRFSDLNVTQGAISDGFSSLDQPRFDFVYLNPPYFDDEEKITPIVSQKRAAWIADDGLEAWLSYAKKAVRDYGDIFIIHRADRLADILAGLSDRCGSFCVQALHPFATAPAKRVIIQAKRLGKAPLTILPAIILHDDGDRKHTAMIEEVLKGAELKLEK